jgi:hypothetical protein
MGTHALAMALGVRVLQRPFSWQVMVGGFLKPGLQVAVQVSLIGAAS